MQQTITNGELGSLVRAALNEMFSELYGAVSLPIKLPNVGVNSQVNIPANTFVLYILVKPILDAATIRIGTTGGGDEILGDTVMNDVLPLLLQKDFDAATTFYFTINGGYVSISILTVLNVF